MTQHQFNPLTIVLADPHRLFDGLEDVLGFVGLDVPLDVVLASGRPFFHLPWRKGRATPLADRWLESSFPGWARSILQDWLEGTFDAFTQVVFSRGDDAAQRLYYYICELQRRGIAAGPQPLIFDVARIQRPSSLKHCEHSIRGLLEALSIDDEMLASGIAQANEHRFLMTQLDAARAGDGHRYENVARAALFSPCWPLLQQLQLPDAAVGPRMLLSGSVPPDDTLHRAAEAVGWNIVGEFHQLSLTRHGAPVVADGCGNVEALARHCHAAEGTSRDFSDRAANLVQLARHKHADAVVLWLTDEDEVLAWHLARQRAALGEAGIPHLVLARQRWDGADGADDKIREFLQENAR
jgi:hypothetical protein